MSSSNETMPGRRAHVGAAVAVSLFAATLGHPAPTRAFGPEGANPKPSPAQATPKKTKVTKLADLPPHTYAIADKPSVLVQDAAKMRVLAAQIERDIRADLQAYDIQDPATLRDLYGTLLTVAMLRKDFAAARGYIETVRGLQEKPAARLLSGLNTRALIAAMENPGADFHATLRAHLRRALGEVPYAPVQDSLKATKGGLEVLSKDLLVGSLAASVDPVAPAGKLSQELAAGLIGAAYTLQYVLPNKADLVAVYTAVLDANKTALKPDIWKARDLALSPQAKLAPVVVAVWDSGSDVGVYGEQLYQNPREVGGNNVDDDNNGFVDDVHGIAWNLRSEPAVGPLMPTQSLTVDPKENLAIVKGWQDLQANVESPEATALKAKLAGLPQDQVKPFLESVSQYGLYTHGTHVAGIALRGNPAARLLVCRMTWDHRMIPEAPTLEKAQKTAAAYARTVDYFKKSGVRVVNMSWRVGPKAYETALEMNKAGGDAASRKALARKIYDIERNALYEAIKNAPEILFVPAAGNEDNDVTFNEYYPSAFRLPNVLVAGAVDQAGEQTAFTSFGNVDVYASGFEVESTVPGGDKVKFSGTSMAAPQVANLAAKLWALDAELSVGEVKARILETADKQMVTGKALLLLNPRKALATVGGPAVSQR